MVHSITLEHTRQYPETNIEFERDEKFLITECIQNNQDAQRVLYESNYNLLLGICIRYLNEPAEAEDVLHDCFIVIFNKLDRFNFQSKLITWMSRVVINGCLAHLKKKKLLQIDHSQPIEEIHQTELTEEELKGHSVKEILELLNKLPTGYKTVLCLYSIDGLSHKKIAKMLSITESSSRSQLYRGRQYFRELLSNNSQHG